jgi:predicted small lipoprotein YifL
MINNSIIIKMHRSLLIIFALSGYFLLIGCGTKGPLYIPEQRYPQKDTQAQPATTTPVNTQPKN